MSHPTRFLIIVFFGVWCFSVYSMVEESITFSPHGHINIVNHFGNIKIIVHDDSTRMKMLVVSSKPTTPPSEKTSWISVDGKDNVGKSLFTKLISYRAEKLDIVLEVPSGTYIDAEVSFQGAIGTFGYRAQEKFFINDQVQKLICQLIAVKPKL